MKQSGKPLSAVRKHQRDNISVAHLLHHRSGRFLIAPTGSVTPSCTLKLTTYVKGQQKPGLTSMLLSRVSVVQK